MEINMIFELDNDFKTLTHLKYWDFGNYSKNEKDLEILLSQHLFNTLFENTPLLPIHREIRGQAEADIYALNERGDLAIFELKRSAVYSGALDQLLRYTEEAGIWK